MQKLYPNKENGEPELVLGRAQGLRQSQQSKPPPSPGLIEEKQIRGKGAELRRDSQIQQCCCDSQSISLLLLGAPAAVMMADLELQSSCGPRLMGSL